MNLNLLQQQEKKEVAYPGKFLGYTFDYSLGPTGVYRKDDKIYASLFGEIELNPKLKPPQIFVVSKNVEYRPVIGDEVYFKVSKVTKTTVMGEIISTINKPIKTSIPSIIKSDNIKSDFREFDIYECFTPGDVVFCKVISVDQTNYICLSTQDVKYGVVFAKSGLTQNLMMPMNFENMMCLDTKVIEKRKVAKPLFT